MMMKELMNRRRALSLLGTSGVAAVLLKQPTAARAATDEIDLAKLPAKVRRCRQGGPRGVLVQRVQG